MESADRYALVLRRELRSAERLSEAAIFFGSVSLKTPCFRSSASLSCVTRCDQRLGGDLVADDLVADDLAADDLAADLLAEVLFCAEPGLRALVRLVLRLILRAAVLCECACFRRRSTMMDSFAPKNDNRPRSVPSHNAGTLALQTRCLESLGTSIFPGIPRWSDPNGWQSSQPLSVLDRRAPFLEFCRRQARSNAAWPAGMMRQFF